MEAITESSDLSNSIFPLHHHQHFDGDRRLRVAAGVIEEFATNEVVLREHISRLEGEIAGYRLVAVEAVWRSGELLKQLDRLREQHGRVTDECRTLRAQVMSETRGR